MEVITSFDIRHDCWSGAADRIEMLTDDQIDTLESYLEDMYADDIPSMTEVNDFIWFEDSTWVEWLGFDSLEELEFVNNANSDVYRFTEYNDELYEFDDIVDMYEKGDADLVEGCGYDNVEEFYEDYPSVDNVIDDFFEFIG